MANSKSKLGVWILTALLFLGLGVGLYLKQSRNPALATSASLTEAPVTDAHRAMTQVKDGLNVSRPLTTDDVKGRILLLDFWTFACINCMHIIPDLQKLEHEFGKDLTVIGVHSAKFENEKDTSNIRAAISRYDIEHAVVNDSDFLVWNSFGVNAWPTLILVNPDGQIETKYSGEGHLDEMRRDITKLQKRYSGRLNTSTLPYELEKNKKAESLLKFPGKLAYAADTGILWITDSNRHRVLGFKLDLEHKTADLKTTVGTTDLSGKADGDFNQASFNRPQGILYQDQALYIADTLNHLLRKIDLRTGKVSTLAGTGIQGFERTPKNAAALKTPLASPWDVTFADASKQKLAIAMAGTHQLWIYDLAQKTVSVLAGNGRESIDDGAYPRNSLSQPSGMSLVGEKLYFVDSETSSLRVLEKGVVTTLIGTGLFDFGFKDGKQGIARMQHPLGVFSDSTGVYIADTYNHSIRKYDPTRKTLETIAGKGRSGNADGPAQQSKFFEPAGLIKVGEALLVADTNNHQIRLLDLKNKSVLTLQLLGGKSEPAQNSAAPAHSSRLKPAKVLPFAQKNSGPLQLQAAKPVTVRVSLDPGWKINEEAPTWMALYQGDRLVQEYKKEELKKGELSLPALKAGTSYRLQGSFYFCEKKSGSVCLVQSIDQNIQVPEAAGASTFEIMLSFKK